MFDNTSSNLAICYLMCVMFCDVLALTNKRFTVCKSGTLEPRILKAFS